MERGACGLGTCDLGRGGVVSCKVDAIWDRVDYRTVRDSIRSQRVPRARRIRSGVSRACGRVHVHVPCCMQLQPSPYILIHVRTRYVCFRVVCRSRGEDRGSEVRGSRSGKVGSDATDATPQTPRSGPHRTAHVTRHAHTPYDRTAIMDKESRRIKP